MNPEAALSSTQIKNICSLHGLDYVSHSRITSGFSHEVHKLNDDMVIKFFSKECKRGYDTEIAMLSTPTSFKKPRLIASSDEPEGLVGSYIIMSYIKGHTLGSKWHVASDDQREHLIKEICGQLREINQMDASELPAMEEVSWRDHLRKQGGRFLSELRSKNIIDQETANKIAQKIEDNLVLFRKDTTLPVYWDIHFDNFIVDDNLQLQAVIDLENVELTAIDYPLFVVQKQTDEPEKYYSKENEQYANQEDYRNLKIWYKRYYPELFDHNDSCRRVEIYQLLDTLHLLRDWSHVKSLHTKLHELLSQ